MVLHIHSPEDIDKNHWKGIKGIKNSCQSIILKLKFYTDISIVFFFIYLVESQYQNMVYKIKPSEPPLLYEENSRCERKRRYCLKPIKLIESKAAKDDASVNILFNRLVLLCLHSFY